MIQLFDNTELYSSKENNSGPADCNCSINTGSVGNTIQKKSSKMF